MVWYGKDDEPMTKCDRDVAPHEWARDESYDRSRGERLKRENELLISRMALARTQGYELNYVPHYGIKPRYRLSILKNRNGEL